MISRLKVWLVILIHHSYLNLSFQEMSHFTNWPPEYLMGLFEYYPISQDHFRYKGDALLKILIKEQVPILRATWYIKVVYLNLKSNPQKVPL